MKEENKLNCALIKRSNGIYEYISIKIEERDIEDDLHERSSKLVIYVGKDPIITIPSTSLPSFEEGIEKIIDKSYLSICKNGLTPVENLLKGLDLDIRAWSNNNYDSHFLYYKISFPLLKRLKEVGETKFQIIFQQEILKRYATSPLQVKKYLEQKGYLKLISDFF
ncbi:MAG: hypothetical protein ACW96X_03100 [Promethearchaeota archaeon]|jgi:hypothetical protein